MKKITIIAALIMGMQSVIAQINLSHPPVIDKTNSNVFLDASVNFSAPAGASNNIGKGLVIPSVNLVNFEFIGSFISSTDSPAFYDGMIVYNNASGTTLTSGNRSSVATAVSPGFYYFSNPSGSSTENVTGGTWKPLGGSVVSKDITAAEIEMPIKIAGSQVYAIKGTFTASGTSAIVTIPKPTGITGYYSITISNSDSTLKRNSISSFTINASDITVVTGNGMMSEVYPGPGETYNYVLEYFK